MSSLGGTEPFVFEPLAQRIVGLIAQRDRHGLDEALSLLRSFYPGEAAAVARAYELACMVVVKRTRAQDASTLISTAADFSVMAAAQDLANGNSQSAFSLLRGAITGGAQQMLARQVAAGLLRSISRSDRLVIVSYSPQWVSSLEVGRVQGAGFVLAPASGPVHLCSDADVAIDARQGLMRFSDRRADLHRVDWVSYLADLNRRDASKDSRSGTAVRSDGTPDFQDGIPDLAGVAA